MSDSALSKYHPIRLTRDTDGMCEVSICVRGMWVPVIRDNGDIICHTVGVFAISDIVKREVSK